MPAVVRRGVAYGGMHMPPDAAKTGHQLVSMCTTAIIACTALYQLRSTCPTTAVDVRLLSVINGYLVATMCMGGMENIWEFYLHHASVVGGVSLIGLYLERHDTIMCAREGRLLALGEVSSIFLSARCVIKTLGMPPNLLVDGCFVVTFFATRTVGFTYVLGSFASQWDVIRAQGMSGVAYLFVVPVWALNMYWSSKIGRLAWKTVVKRKCDGKLIQEVVEG
jgi:hypothetical protein